MHNHLINDARPEAALVLADGAVFKGRSIGVSGMAVGEVVFNTAMTGYQEILTDPSYTGQIVTLTYPHIGNVGVNQDDVESSDVHVAGLVIRSESPVVSNWRGQRSLTEYLKQNGIVAIAEVDTRRLTRILRTTGAQTGCIVAAAEGKLTDNEIAVAAKTAAEAPGQELASKVSDLPLRMGRRYLAHGQRSRAPGVLPTRRLSLQRGRLGFRRKRKHPSFNG